jgi:predicted ester cyclase
MSAQRSTAEENKAFVRQHFEDFVNNRKAQVIRQNMTPDFLDHDGPGGKPADRAADEKMMEAMYASMPGLRVTIEDMVAEGDKVVCRSVWRWNDAKTGKPWEFHGFVEWRLRDGKISERWATVSAPREDAAS